jgi:hypothetical protein
MVRAGTHELSEMEKDFMKRQRKAAFFKTLDVKGTNKPAVITHEDYTWASQYDWFCNGPRGNVARTVHLDGKRVIIYLRDEMFWRAVIYRGTPSKGRVKKPLVIRRLRRRPGPAIIIEFPKPKDNNNAK